MFKWWATRKRRKKMLLNLEREIQQLAKSQNTYWDLRRTEMQENNGKETDWARYLASFNEWAARRRGLLRDAELDLKNGRHPLDVAEMLAKEFVAPPEEPSGFEALEEQHA